MKKTITTLTIILFFNILPLLNMAQQDGPGDPGGEPGGNPPLGGGAPIGSGLGILLGLGAAYGGRKVYMIYQKKKSLLES